MVIRSPLQRYFHVAELAFAKGDKWPLLLLTLGPAMLLVTVLAVLGSVHWLFVGLGGVWALLGLGVMLTLTWHQRLFCRPASSMAIACALGHEPHAVVQRVSAKAAVWTADPRYPVLMLPSLCAMIDEAREALALPGTRAAARRAQTRSIEAIAARA